MKKVEISGTFSCSSDHQLDESDYKSLGNAIDRYFSKKQWKLVHNHNPYRFYTNGSSNIKVIHEYLAGDHHTGIFGEFFIRSTFDNECEKYSDLLGAIMVICDNRDVKTNGHLFFINDNVGLHHKIVNNTFTKTKFHPGSHPGSTCVEECMSN